MYSIDLRNLVKNKLYICKNYHIQPSEIDKMEYFNYEYMLEDIKEIQDEEQKRADEQESGSGMGDMSKQMRSMQNSMTSTMSNFKMPSIGSLK